MVRSIDLPSGSGIPAMREEDLLCRIAYLEIAVATQRQHAARWQEIAGVYDEIRYELRNCDEMSGTSGTGFVLGQRVRVRQYKVTWIEDPHFIVGHFGHVEKISHDFFDVRISHGPNGGAIDHRVLDTVEDDVPEDDPLVWPMLAEELEPVD